MTTLMLCTYCSTRKPWPDEFPLRTEACCAACGVHIYGWPDLLDPDTDIG